MIDWQPLLLSFKLAIVTTAILLIISIPLAYWLSKGKSNFKLILQTIVSLPLVLPPSVLGFYMLLAFSPNYFFGNFLKTYFDLHLVFTFNGLVVASVIYSLPFMIQPLISGFHAVPSSLTDAAFSLGKNKWQTLYRVQLPNMKPFIYSATVLSFAHVIGEFGVVLMIGGNIPGETKLASIAIYDEVQSMNYSTANIYSVILLCISFTILLSVHFINRKLQKK